MASNFDNPYFVPRNRIEKRFAAFHSASNLRSRIAREQWEDYKTRFQPLENTLLNLVGNRQKFVTEQVNNAQGLINKQFASAPGQIERRIHSYGLSISPEQQQQIDNRMSYDKSLAMVQGSNMAKRTADDQITELIGGGLLNVSGRGG